MIGLYRCSHWQGSTPRTLIAVGSPAAVRNAVSCLSTCSFCRPGRTSNYSVGACYDDGPVRYRGDAPELPAEASTWEQDDFLRWLRDAA